MTKTFIAFSNEYTQLKAYYKTYIKITKLFNKKAKEDYLIYQRNEGVGISVNLNEKKLAQILHSLFTYGLIPHPQVEEDSIIITFEEDKDFNELKRAIELNTRLKEAMHEN